MFNNKIFRLIENESGFEAIGYRQAMYVVTLGDPFELDSTTYINSYLLFGPDIGVYGTPESPLAIKFTNLGVIEQRISLGDFESGRFSYSGTNKAELSIDDSIPASTENVQIYADIRDRIRYSTNPLIINSGHYLRPREEQVQTIIERMADVIEVTTRHRGVASITDNPLYFNNDIISSRPYYTRPYDYGADGYTHKEETKKSMNKTENVFTYDELVSLFKYIPMIFNGVSGFYNPATELFMGKTIFIRKGVEKSKLHSSSFTKELETLEGTIPYNFSFDVLKEFCKFKVKSYEQSSNLFSFGKIKKESLGKIVEITKAEFNATVKKSDKLEQTVYVKIDSTSYRFLLSDIEIIYPNVNGWTAPKDRRIVKNSKVRIVNNKHMSGIKKNDVVIVKEIKHIGKKQYVGIENKGKLIFEKMNKFRTI